ncbi:angio-associated migratory cell protein-like [Temnothorax curvispinosus]|uniref:Angio-associated migratory cell protein-like n=1 Tax=Temnothorax curvispinosus TaxID=300111 RepID=A0A6J1RE13_9HYME|nr:angio-associated migratory cell protein-like [Temnothorax curvispinosus]
MMQGRHTPPSPPEVGNLDSDEMILEVGDIEEIIDMDDSIFESEGSSGNENEGPPVDEDHAQEEDDDAVCVFRGHTPKFTVFCCSLSKNGELAASGDENDKAYLWNANTGESIFSTGNSHDDSVIFAEFNYNDKYIATADMRGKIKLWRISDKTCIWETTLSNDITWIKWHHFSDVLIAGVVTGEVYMLKTRNDDCKVFAHGTGDRSETGVILPDGKRAAIGYQSGTIHVIDLKSNTVLSTTPRDQTRSRGHASAIIAIDCHVDNNLLISVSLQSQTILSTAHNGKVICILQDLNRNEAGNNTNNVETAAFCKDPTFPAAATGTVMSDIQGKIYIWDISKQILRHEMEQEGGITKLVWIKTILFTAGLDGKVRCFDARAGECLRQFSGHKAALYDLCISSGEKKALTVSDDSTARIFDISTVC